MVVHGVPAYVNYTPGDDEVEAVKPSQVVATWGIQVPGRNGGRKDLLMGWKVDGYRKDKRHGAQGKPAPSTDYAKDLFQSMFKGW